MGKFALKIERWDCVSLGAIRRHMFVYFVFERYIRNPITLPQLFFSQRFYVVDLFEADEKHLPLRKICIFNVPEWTPNFW